MKQTIVKFIIIANIVLLALPLNIIAFALPERARAQDTADDVTGPPPLGAKELADEDPRSEIDHVGGVDVGANLPVDEPKLPQSVKNLQGFFDSNFTPDKKSTDGFLWDAENILQNPKLIFNPADQQDLRILYCLGNVVPDYANNLDSLATASGKSYADVVALKSNDDAGFQKLVTQTQEAARKKIVAGLKTDIPNFACIAGVDEATAQYMLKYEPDEVDLITNYAKDEVIIDIRVLKMLVYLVTPKDQGGADHERINVYRLRRNYDRPAVMFSRESDAIREETRAKDESQTLNKTTIADIENQSNKDLNKKLEADPVLDQSTIAAATVTDGTAGNRSVSQLVFTDTEDDINISAHAHGEAVDISEVDNIRCTQIGKKRIGSDKKTKLPMTPIKLAWQTAEGYDQNPPPDYLSLNANLNQIASGQFQTLLDEFGIDIDSEVDLSDASFSDLISIVGQSLIAEVMNSPNGSLDGFSFSDTIRKIGGMILADKLDLPRRPFVEGDLASLSDLETRIGRSVLEKKLGLPYDSLKGTNLREILTNIGLRNLESQTGVPAGTIDPNITDRGALNLLTGRRLIDQALSLPAGSFSADSTFAKLKQIGGERKIDLSFAIPSGIDDTLKLPLGTSASFQAGSLSPDQFANAVGDKAVNSHLLQFAGPGANSNALGATTAKVWNPGLNNFSNDKINISDITAGQNLPISMLSLGIDTLSRALTTNPDVRSALVIWLTGNYDSANCSSPNPIIVNNVPSEDGSRISVTLPEDLFMTSFGLRRGDLFRLFGCSSVKPNPVLKNLGETALFLAVKNSSAAERLSNQLLSQHPELTSALRDFEFYKSRIDAVKSNLDKINNDWRGVSGDSAIAIRDSITALETQVTLAVAMNSGGAILQTTRLIEVATDNLVQSITVAQGSSDQTLRDRANATLAAAGDIIQAVDEIVSGQEQPRIKNLQIGDLSIYGNLSTRDQSTDNGFHLNTLTLAMMLAGKISPSDFLISVGSGKVESSLDLPMNSMLYYAQFARDSNKEKTNGKSGFFRAIGQAQIEETFNMPPFFFQGDVSGDKATLSDVKKHIAKSFSVSEAEAGAQIMRALNLPGDFSSIERGQISNVSSIALASNQIDQKLGLKEGTTADFLGGKPLNSETIGNSDIRNLADALNITPNTADRYVAAKKGIVPLSNLEDAQKAGQITHVDHNEFASKDAPRGTVDGACAVTFDIKTGRLGFMDNSFATNTTEGVRSFTSSNAAIKYMDENEGKQVSEIKAIAKGLKTQGASGSEEEIANKLKKTASDPSGDPLFDTNEIKTIATKASIDENTLDNFLNRPDAREIKEAGGNKAIGPYLEIVGTKTAERRILFAVFSGLNLTIAGQRVDAVDIYDILSGNGKAVAYRLGSRHLEEQFNIPAGLVQALIESPTQALRDCSLADIGGNILGSFLGLGTVSLSGNIYENIGGARIEEALNLPPKSFRGANLQELINNVGPVAFARAFQLPPEATLDRYYQENPDSGLAKQQPAKNQYDQVDILYSNPTDVSYHDALADLNDIANRDLSYATSSVGASYSSSPQTVSDYRNNQYQTRPREIDGILGLPEGTTKDLLTGKITPDQYRHKAADAALTAMAALKLVDLLGIDIGSVNPAEIVKAIKNGNFAAVIDTVGKIFGLNLDRKLGLPDGSIKMIIDDPTRAREVIINGALARLDRSLGLDPNSATSLSHAYKNGVCRSGILTSNCLNEVAVSLLSKYIDEWSIIIEDYNIAQRDLSQLVNGDMRGLIVTAAVQAAGVLNTFVDDANRGLPSAYRISYGDIRYAIFGDVRNEFDYGGQAGKNYLTSVVSGTPAPSTDSPGPLEGTQCPPGAPSAGCVVGQNGSFNYNADLSVADLKNKFNAGNPSDATLNDPATYDSTVANLQNKNPDAAEGLIQAKEFGAAKSRSDMQKILLYRMADAKLWQVDHNIPVGFTMVMIYGTADQRNQMLLTYINNGLTNGTLFGLDLGISIDVVLLKSIKGFIDNPSSINLDTLLSAGQLQKFDDWLAEKAGDMLGFDFLPGTFTALAYGLKTGDYLGDHVVGNTTVHGLATIYTDWAAGKITGFADKLLGLPRGTTVQVINYYSNVVQAKNALAVANVSGKAEEISKAKANLASVQAEMISYVINIVFSKQIAAAEQVLGLVPGTGSIAISAAVSYLITGAVPWVAIAIFVAINLFGVYDTDVICTADGYYPRLESPPDPTVYDNGNLGEFDALDAAARKAGFIAAAQYKARALATDVLNFPLISADDNFIPAQIMVGRQEDADYLSYLTDEVICASIGGSCKDTRAGVWKNIQTTNYTHIGF